MTTLRILWWRLYSTYLRQCVRADMRDAVYKCKRLGVRYDSEFTFYSGEIWDVTVTKRGHTHADNSQALWGQ